MNGNSVKIGDGCATVTGYEPPDKPLRVRLAREGGGKVWCPKSGDRFSHARLVPDLPEPLLRHREGWDLSADWFSAGYVECLHSTDWRRM